jgi:hypothetical protein
VEVFERIAGITGSGLIAWPVARMLGYDVRTLVLPPVESLFLIRHPGESRDPASFVFSGHHLD